MGRVSIDKQAHTPTRTISTHKSITAKHEGCCSFSTVRSQCVFPRAELWTRAGGEKPLYGSLDCQLLGL